MVFCLKLEQKQQLIFFKVSHFWFLAVQLSFFFLFLSQMLRNGHKGLLTLNTTAPAEKLTTNRSSYAKPTFPQVAQMGKLFQQEYQKAVQESTTKLQQATTPEKQKMETQSVKQQDFDQVDFIFQPPQPTRQHDLYRENGDSFWTDNAHKIQGVSQQRVANFPFRKNTAFSKPYTEYHGESLPHDINNVM